MRAVDSYRNEDDSLEELNEYRNGSKKTTKKEWQKAMNKMAKNSDEEKFDKVSLKNTKKKHRVEKKHFEEV